MSTRKLLTGLALASIASLSLSCDVLECGEGTLEKNGECVPAEGQIPENIYCAEGTHYEAETQSCVSDLPPTICGEFSEPVVNPDTGIVECIGTGGGGCRISCPAPDPGKNTICGQLLDSETLEPVTVEGGGTGTLCDDIPEADRTGPCLMKLEFYDALEYAQAPTTTPQQASDEIVINDCGYYKAHNIETPGLGYMAVGADDAEDAPEDIWVQTGVAFPVAPRERRENYETYATRITTDEKWTETAGNPFSAGATFGETGVFFPFFTLEGEPVEGVQITRLGSVRPADDYYFDDNETDTRSSVDPAQSATGVNGAGLLVRTSLDEHSGTGGDLPSHCEWWSDLAASVVGVVLASERVAVDSDNPDEDCEP